MNPELRLKEILIASKIADWYSIDTVTVIESQTPDLKQVIEEIIDLMAE